MRPSNPSAAVKNVNSLTLAFTNAVAKAQKDKNDNVVFSSYNAQTCLSMVAAGAEGETKKELAEVLFGLADESRLDSAIRSFSALNDEIREANKGKVTLKTANAIWVNSDRAPLKGKFKKDMEQTFDAKIDSRSFGDSSLLPEINQWASDNTEGKITEILKELDGGDYAVLAAALFFKAPWTHKFDAKLTMDKNFQADNGSVSKIPTMRQEYSDKQGLRYHETRAYQAVSLTYGENDPANGATPPLRLILVRPKDDAQSAREWLATQSGSSAAWLDDAFYEKARGVVELPRLDIAQEHNLVGVLKDMGVKAAFNVANADFSKMTKEGVYLSQVKQNIVFKTDEQGSEGAAVTTAVMRTRGMPPPVKTIDVKFNRSFVFAVQDIQSGAVLFAGAVNKPVKDAKAASPKP